MLAGNAAGKVAPVYVVYKSEKLWQTWMENGPENARYSRSRSGWFDYQCFEDWFVNLMVPILKRQEGKKVLLGDNLSSHLNIEAIRQCENNNISFIALPPHATYLLQPLDVAFFRPMKGRWRAILHEWKDSMIGSRCGTIPKDQFPALLKKLMVSMNDRGAVGEEDATTVVEKDAAAVEEEEATTVGEKDATAVAKEEVDKPNIADYVIIQYEGSMFPGVVTGVEKQGVNVSSMEKCGRFWKWPDREDQLMYEFADVIQTKINAPVQISRRAIFQVPEMDIYVNK
ncbi:uncharacterized protein LOC126886899 [Diabrotica virgifera virgifera]|uniref:DDE-1 domain-containing protein n=1 Tax=Diabrotica virgifera virgifera TaxID=50390 RepID=A0ABM5KIG1_DIAVI|nr:uncharacterized protein LOC126886899 [Diabrotica virgifera virgifera]